MPFSIPLSELTPDLLETSEYWRIIQFVNPFKRVRADTRHKEHIYDVGGRWESFGVMYSDSTRCYPVSISPDGSETRLECPRMPDELEIDLPPTNRPVYSVAPINSLSKCWEWIAEYDALYNTRKLARADAPTYDHYPRKTLEGTWVWTTRK